MNRQERAVLAEKFEQHLEQQREIIHAMQAVAQAVTDAAAALSTAVADGARAVTDAATPLSTAVEGGAHAVTDVADEIRTANLISTLTLDVANVRQSSIPTVTAVQERLGLNQGAPAQRSKP